jgi:hypothetical protein
MKPHLAAVGPDIGQIVNFLLVLVSSIGTVSSIALVMWLATVMAL